MRYRLILDDLVQREIVEAAAWYEERQEGVGERFVQRIREKIAMIRGNPYLYQKRYRHMRSAALQQFPYNIHYAVNETEQCVVILAVVHSGRDPEEMKKRL